MNADFISAIQELGKEKGIDPEILYKAVEDALVAAYKKKYWYYPECPCRYEQDKR